MVNGIPNTPGATASTAVPPTTTANSAIQQNAAPVAAGNAAAADMKNVLASVSTALTDLFKANASLTQPPTLSPPKTLGASDPLLQEVVRMLNNPSTSAEDLQSIITGLMTKMSDFTTAQEANNIKDRSTEMKAAQDKRAQQIQDIAKNAADQANLGFWGKLLNIFSKIGSTLAAVATIALGSALAPFSGGVSLAITVYGAYSLAVAVTDTIKEIYTAAGGTGWNFSLTLGQGIAALAQLMGASQETANWIKMGVDMAVDLAAAVVLMVIPGGQVKAAQLIKNTSTNLAEIADAASKLNKFASKMGRGATRLTTSANVTTNTTKMAQGGVQIAQADKAYDNAQIKAAMDSLKLMIDFLQQLQQMALDFMQGMLDSNVKNFEINASSLKIKSESQLLMANSGRTNMA
jgi:hypothetical protein